MRVSSRRQFISRAGSLLGFAVMQPWWARAQSPSHAKTRLILLGTGGGPRPRKNSFASSQVIIVNNVAHVVDCGNGVAIQLARAGCRYPRFATSSLPTSIPTITLITVTFSSWRGRAG